MEVNLYSIMKMTYLCTQKIYFLQMEEYLKFVIMLRKTVIFTNIFSFRIQFKFLIQVAAKSFHINIIKKIWNKRLLVYVIFSVKNVWNSILFKYIYQVTKLSSRKKIKYKMFNNKIDRLAQKVHHTNATLKLFYMDNWDLRSFRSTEQKL